MSPDEKWLVTGGGTDYTIRVWDLATGKWLRMFQAPLKMGNMTITKDGKTMYVGDDCFKAFKPFSHFGFSGLQGQTIT